MIISDDGDEYPHCSYELAHKKLPETLIDAEQASHLATFSRDRITSRFTAQLASRFLLLCSSLQFLIAILRVVRFKR